MIRTMWNWLQRMFEDPPLTLELGSSGTRFFIHREYQLDIPFPDYDSRRPFRILRYLEMRKLLKRGMLGRPRSVSLARLELVHEPDYLRSLEDRRQMGEMLGLTLDARSQDQFLVFQRLMCGGTLRAMRHTLKHRQPGINLGGGLHHAERNRGSGFCLFNDVAVAIASLRAREDPSKVLIIDLDLHDGEGTRAIFADDPTVHTFSIHNRTLGSDEAVASTCIELGGEVEDTAYLAAVEKHLPPLYEAFRPDLVFYLAGCDPLVDDRLGNWRVTLDGLMRRDRLVMDLVGGRGEKLETPTVITLAGGYGPQAWRHGAALFSWMLTGDSRLDIPLELELPVNHYRKLARLMRQPEAVLNSEKVSGKAKAEDAWGLKEEDLGGAVTPSESLFLGTYSRLGIEFALEKYGLMGGLRSRGYKGLRIEFDLDDPMGHTLRVVTGDAEPLVLLEMKLRRETRPGDGDYLVVEWLLIQDAASRFEISGPLLPGQQHPGLGLLRDAAAVLVVVCERMHLQGILFTPSQYHLARLARPMAFFPDPRSQARFQAIDRAVRSLRLAEAAEAVTQGRVVDEDSGRPVEWAPDQMVVPVAAAVKDRFKAAAYRDAVENACAGYRFVLVDQTSTDPAR